MTPEFSRQVFEKYLNNKFHEGLFSGSWIPRGRTNTHTHTHTQTNGQKDMTQLTVVYRNCTNAPKNQLVDTA